MLYFDYISIDLSGVSWVFIMPWVFAFSQLFRTWWIFSCVNHSVRLSFFSVLMLIGGDAEYDFLFCFKCSLDEIFLMKFRCFFVALLFFSVLVFVEFLVTVFVFAGGMNLLTIVFAHLLTFVMMHKWICDCMMALCVFSKSWPSINPIIMSILNQHRFLHAIKLFDTLIQQIFMNLSLLKWFLLARMGFVVVLLFSYFLLIKF